MAENQTDEDKNSGSLQTLVVVVLLIFVGYQIYSGVSLKKVGIPGLFEIEFAEKDPTPPEPKPNLKPEPPDKPKPPVKLTSINLAYSGDYHACNLPLSINIGERQVFPQGNFFPVNGVRVGNQSYEITGSIHCPILGSCKVSGQGFIDVQPGRTYNVYWQNTDLGMCNAFLQ